jgi:hypothetical protein
MLFVAFLDSMQTTPDPTAGAIAQSCVLFCACVPKVWEAKVLTQLRCEGEGARISNLQSIKCSCALQATTNQIQILNT